MIWHRHTQTRPEHVPATQILASRVGVLSVKENEDYNKNDEKSENNFGKWTTVVWTLFTSGASIDSFHFSISKRGRFRLGIPTVNKCHCAHALFPQLLALCRVVRRGFKDVKLRNQLRKIPCRIFETRASCSVSSCPGHQVAGSKSATVQFPISVHLWLNH